MEHLLTRNRNQQGYECTTGCAAYKCSMHCITRRPDSTITGIHTGLLSECTRPYTTQSGSVLQCRAGLRKFWAQHRFGSSKFHDYSFLPTILLLKHDPTEMMTNIINLFPSSVSIIPCVCPSCRHSSPLSFFSLLHIKTVPSSSHTLYIDASGFLRAWNCLLQISRFFNCILLWFLCFWCNS
jgi:hypothetical protein